MLKQGFPNQAFCPPWSTVKHTVEKVLPVFSQSALSSNSMVVENRGGKPMSKVPLPSLVPELSLGPCWRGIKYLLLLNIRTMSHHVSFSHRFYCILFYFKGWKVGTPTLAEILLLNLVSQNASGLIEVVDFSDFLCRFSWFSGATLVGTHYAKQQDFAHYLLSWERVQWLFCLHYGN